MGVRAKVLDAEVFSGKMPQLSFKTVFFLFKFYSKLRQLDLSVAGALDWGTKKNKWDHKVIGIEPAAKILMSGAQPTMLELT